MLRRTICSVLCLLPILLDIRSASAAPAPHLVLESRNVSEDLLHKILLRELPRQALIVAAGSCEDPVVDRTVDLLTPNAPDDTQLFIGEEYDTGKKLLRVTVLDSKDKELKSLELPLEIHANDHVNYAALLPVVEKLCDEQMIPLLADVADTKTSPGIAQAGGKPLPADVERLLERVDPQSAFLAGRLLHAAVAKDGESPERLAGLARAYANLGDATRHLYNEDAAAFLARACIYGQRAVRMYPNDAIAYCARGYALTLMGRPVEGRDDFEHARKLAGGGIPPWASLADDLAHFRTGALFNRIRPDGSPLASYFAALTIEQSGLLSTAINLARLALAADPGALRMIDVMTSNSGVALRHETTVKAATAQFEALAALSDVDAAPEAVRQAAPAAANAQQKPEALQRLMEAMQNQPLEPGQLLPWSIYAGITEDDLFVAGFRRLYFTKFMLDVDPSDRVASWWPILKDHRYAAVIASFDESGKIGGSRQQIADRLRATHFRDLPISASALSEYVQSFDPPMPPGPVHSAPRHVTSRPKPTTRNVESFGLSTNTDDTVYDIVYELRVNDEAAGDRPVIGMILTYIAKSLDEMCPDHPAALESLILHDWPHTRDRAAQIERDFGGNPQVALALARAYRDDHREADAIRLYEQLVPLVPDRGVYEELAELYRKQGHEEKWLATLQAYLKNTEDFGLDHAMVDQDIAYALMREKHADQALPYASAAAESYSAWGPEVYANCLTELGRYSEAEKVEQAHQERYTGSVAWYRWCQTTGKGNLPQARRATAIKAMQNSSSDQETILNEIGIYYQLEGQLDRALACFVPFANGVYDASQLAMIQLEQGKADDAKATLKAVAQQPHSRFDNDTAREKIYRAAVNEVLRCLQDAKATPRRDGEMKILLDATDSPYRGNASYFLGRACELTGRKDDAKWWYHVSMDTREWTFSCRPQAAACLRRLGEPYYK